LLDGSVAAFDRLGGSRRWAAVLSSRPAAGAYVIGPSVLVPLTTGRLAELAVQDGRQRSASPEAGAAVEGFQGWAAVSGDAPTIYLLTVLADDTRALAAWRRPAKP
jgi:hypothetical protein